MNGIYKVLLSLAIISLLAACASTEDRPAPASPEQLAEQAGYEIVEPVRQVPNYRIDGFNAISNRAVILSSGVKDRYLVTVMSNCVGLRFTQVLATTSTAGSLSTFDAILLRDVPGGAQRCPITNIYKLKKLDSDSSGE